MGKSPRSDDDRQRWREEVLQALQRQRIPPPWRDRLLEELEDHWFDLGENAMSMDAESRRLAQQRLGSPHDVAAAAAAEYRKLGFFARRPLLTYVAVPLLSTPFLFAACAFVAAGVLWVAAAAVEQMLGVLTGGERIDPAGVNFDRFAWTVMIGLRFVPWALLAGTYCWLARRQGRDRRWSLAACAILGVYASVVIGDFDSMSDERTFRIGVLLPPYRLENLVQALVPPIVAALFYWRSPAKRRLSQVSLARAA